MLKIGIIGTDGGKASGHAREVCGLISTGIYDAEITAIYGDDEKETEEVASCCAHSPLITESVAEMAKICDAAMIMYRNGNRHAEYAAEFLKIGKPVFIDKPFTCTVADAAALIREARRTGAVICSGSCVTYAPAIKEVKAEMKKHGMIRSGYISFPLDNRPEYGGIHFYIHHLISQLLDIFEFWEVTVSARSVNGNMIVVADLGEYPVVMNCAANTSGMHVGVYFKDGHSSMRNLCLDSCMRMQLESFIRAVKTGISEKPPEELLLSVKIACAICRALETGHDITISRTETC